MSFVSDKKEALALCPVSRETEQRLDQLVDLLRRWQNIKNLVGPRTLDEVWVRHIADSLQLAELRPDVKAWADFGSGAGFPGLVVACTWSNADREMHLVESNGRKAAFLREAARLLNLPVTVHDCRVEEAMPALLERNIELVSARALSSLDKLIEMAEPLLKKGVEGLFLKGQDVDNELTQATKCWIFKACLWPSKTDPAGRIVSLTEVARRHPAPNGSPELGAGESLK